MKTGNPNFTPNPDRGIHVQGVIDQQMVYRLTPQIVSLQKSREPITVYIDSPGGLTDYKESILKLLKSSNQDFAKPCKVITVAMSLAASSGADLLSSGSYALAYPESAIMYHGVRVPPDRPLTAEETYVLAQRLRVGNESFATQLARDTEARFMFRFISHYHLLEGVRQNHPSKPVSDLQCFLTLISDKVSESANEVMENAYKRYLMYSVLLDSAAKRWKKGTAKKSFVRLEVDQIKAIMEFEVKTNKNNKNWRFETEGIRRLTDDFFLLNEYIAFLQGDRFNAICTTWGTFLLGKEESEELDKLPQPAKDKKLIDRVKPQLRPVWSYFMALCHVLQQGDNHLSALDAFWLGLIDEVIGVQDLPSVRLFTEQGEELAKKEKATHEAEAATEKKADAAAAV